MTQILCPESLLDHHCLFQLSLMLIFMILIKTSMIMILIFIVIATLARPQPWSINGRMTGMITCTPFSKYIWQEIDFHQNYCVYVSLCFYIMHHLDFQTLPYVSTIINSRRARRQRGGIQRQIRQSMGSRTRSGRGWRHCLPAIRSWCYQ